MPQEPSMIALLLLLVDVPELGPEIDALVETVLAAYLESARRIVEEWGK